MKFTISILALVLLLISCGGTTSQKQDTTIAVKNDIITTPVLPHMLRTQLYQSCDAIDIIFYNLPMSMSQTDKLSIHKSISFIGNEPVRLNPDCKPMGHLSFNGQGENLQEVEIYFGNGCFYYVFQDKAGTQYANNMTELGSNFFGKILTQFSGKPNQ